FWVDDDVVVHVNGAQLHRSTAGSASHAPVTFAARLGDDLTVELFDTHGVCLRNDDVWLSGPGILPTPLIWATPRKRRRSRGSASVSSRAAWTLSRTRSR